MTVSQILQQARRKIAAGWCQGNQAVFSVTSANEVTHQRYCLVGALKASETAGQATIARQAAAVIAACIDDGRHYAEDVDRLVLFNDQPGRTQAEVLNVIDAALTEVTK